MTDISHCSNVSASYDANDFAPIQSDGVSHADDDGTGHDAGYLPLGRQGGSYRTVQRLFAQALPWAMLFLGVLSSACLPARGCLPVGW